MRLYVIGPITGHKDLNKPAFSKAKKLLEKCGYTVVIPHDVAKDPKTQDPEIAWRLYMRQSIRAMMTFHGVAHLECKPSRGSSIELALACDVGIPIGSVTDWVRRAKKNLDYAEQAGLEYA